MVNDKEYMKLLQKMHKLENQLFDLTKLIGQGGSLGDIMRFASRLRDDLEKSLLSYSHSIEDGSDESE
tara:strand:+ start:1905 stop:2108 length:204 start_codon:yes stop_codon:yes gene_type:complete